MLSIGIVLSGSSLIMFSETLNDSIFGIKYSFPAPTGPGCTLVANPAEESSHLVSQFDNTDCMRSLSLHCLVSLIPGVTLRSRAFILRRLLLKKS